MLKKINYRSDFDFILNLATRIKNEDGTYERRPLEWLDFDWTATFWTSNKANAYVASRKGDILTNCFEDNGKIHIVVNNHHLGKGILNIEFHSLLPDDIYPDFIRDIYNPQQLDIELIQGSSDCPTDFEAELLLPTLKGDKGDPFTFDDFTAEQIADLQRPAVEAAKRANEATADAIKATSDANDATNYAKEATKEAAEAASKAEDATKQAEQLNQDVTKSEQNRVTAENTRNAAEQSRIEAEDLRVSNEDTRKRAESIRESAEAARDKAEQGRETAENERAEDESLRKSNEQGRIVNESQRNTNENQRITNEQSRVNAESARVTEFATIKSEAETATASANQAAENANAAVAEIPENIVAYTPSDDELENIEPNIVTNALRKTEQHLTESEQKQVLKNLGNPEFKLFVDMWNAAWKSNNTIYGKYDPDNAPDAEHPFMGNKIWMTYKEAILVLQAGRVNKSYAQTTFEGFNIRTNLLNTASSLISSTSGCFQYCGNIEVADVYLFVNGTYLFYNCNNLRIVGSVTRPMYNIVGGNEKSFQNCTKLEEVYGTIRGAGSLYLQDSPLLKFICFEWMIENAVNTGAVTITVHPDVYAKLTGDTTNDAFNNLTDDEKQQWIALLAAAAEKNIQFATA